MESVYNIAVTHNSLTCMYKLHKLLQSTYCTSGGLDVFVASPLNHLSLKVIHIQNICLLSKNQQGLTALSLSLRLHLLLFVLDMFCYHRNMKLTFSKSGHKTMDDNEGSSELSLQTKNLISCN